MKEKTKNSMCANTFRKSGQQRCIHIHTNSIQTEKAKTAEVSIPYSTIVQFTCISTLLSVAYDSEVQK